MLGQQRHHDTTACNAAGAATVFNQYIGHCGVATVTAVQEVVVFYREQLL